MRESSWRIAPAAALRGLTYSFCPACALALVQRVEVAPVHEHLAAHLEVLASWICKRDRAHGAQVGVTSSPVVPSPRVAPWHEDAVAVGQADRQAVELGLDGVLDLLDAQRLAHALVEGAHLLLVEGVADATASACDAAPRRTRRSGARADALRRRIGAAQLRVRRFERLQLAEQAVVLRVGDLRRVLDVVEPVVALDRLPGAF